MYKRKLLSLIILIISCILLCGCKNEINHEMDINCKYQYPNISFASFKKVDNDTTLEVFSDFEWLDNEWNFVFDLHYLCTIEKLMGNDMYETYVKGIIYKIYYEDELIESNEDSIKKQEYKELERQTNSDFSSSYNIYGYSEEISLSFNKHGSYKVEFIIKPYIDGKTYTCKDTFNFSLVNNDKTDYPNSMSVLSVYLESLNVSNITINDIDVIEFYGFDKRDFCYIHLTNKYNKYPYDIETETIENYEFDYVNNKPIYIYDCFIGELYTIKQAYEKNRIDINIVKELYELHIN